MLHDNEAHEGSETNNNTETTRAACASVCVCGETKHAFVVVSENFQIYHDSIT